MARTKIDVPIKDRCGYSSVIVSYSTGIDSTGALYWAVKNFPKNKIFLLYCDTGAEYPINDELFYKTAKFMGVTPVLLKHPKGFLGLLLEERYMFPDSKNRWCTAYLKTGITDKWIRANRHLLGEKCLFISGERRDESRGRAQLPEFEYHSTTLKTTRKGVFECHWHRPVLDFEKGKMFEQSKLLGLDAHPCYEYIDRCSCMVCIFAKDKQVIENIKRYPELIGEYVKAEQKIGHTWKHKKALKELYNECLDISDIDGEEPK
ncbi:MAG: phosphoadenosine phosphosulfate reductase family protein [Acetivibrio sp.]